METLFSKRMMRAAGLATIYATAAAIVALQLRQLLAL